MAADQPSAIRRRRLAVLVVVAAVVLVVVAIRDRDRDDAATVVGAPTTTTLGESTSTTADLSPPTQADLDGIALRLEPLVEQVSHPTRVRELPGSDGMRWVTSLEGKLLRVGADGASSELFDFASEISLKGESGLLDVAFSPDGETAYVSMVAKDGPLVVEALPIVDGAPVTSQARTVISVESPSQVHHAGGMEVDGKGFLWLGVGDGGPVEDPTLRAQQLDDLHGKLLRIDPAHPADGLGYGIPADNPFVGRTDARAEIWSYGLRNPWRFDIDEATGDLWIGDVGRHAVEEVDFAPGGADGAPGGAGFNFGWPYFEGPTPMVAGATGNLVAPIIDYPHGSQCAVTGGFVYRGRAIPALQGAYLYADICDGLVHAAAEVDGAIAATREFADLHAGYPVSLDQDLSGEPYLCSFDAGTVYRIVP